MTTPAIRAQARKGVKAAFAAAGDAVVKCTLKLGPDSEYDPAADEMATTWAFSGENIEAIAYDDAEERPTMDPEVRRRCFLFQGESLGDYAGEQEGEITDEAGETWEVWMVERDPTAAVWIFYCRSPKPAPSP